MVHRSLRQAVGPCTSFVIFKVAVDRRHPGGMSTTPITTMELRESLAGTGRMGWFLENLRAPVGGALTPRAPSVGMVPCTASHSAVAFCRGPAGRKFGAVRSGRWCMHSGGSCYSSPRVWQPYIADTCMSGVGGVSGVSGGT